MAVRLNCSGAKPSLFNYTAYYDWVFDKTPQVLVSTIQLMSDQVDRSEDTSQYVRILKVYRDKIRYQLLCSASSPLRQIYLRFLLTDLPNVEIGDIRVEYLQPEIPRNQTISFKKTYNPAHLRSLQVYQIPFVPEFISTVQIQNSVKIVSRTEKNFTLQVTSSYREWRGNYVVCVSEG